jgi:secondary thiamine-phosphate synthase enzyme
MKTIEVRTSRRAQFADITAEVQEAVTGSGLVEGVVTVYCPHTTAGLTINENADPDVVTDMLDALERAVPWEAGYRHAEGNAAAHVKASMMGTSVQIPVSRGSLGLGTWQGIYFCEFDGPRQRKVWLTMQG